jgi:hypothetical protein
MICLVSRQDPRGKRLYVPRSALRCSASDVHCEHRGMARHPAGSKGPSHQSLGMTVDQPAVARQLSRWPRVLLPKAPKSPAMQIASSPPTRVTLTYN